MLENNDPITHPAGLRDDAQAPSAAGLVSHRWGAAFQNASPRRAAAESFTLVALMLALVLSPSARSGDSQTFLLGSFVLGELAALVLALRLRLPQGKRWRQIGAELVVATVFA